MGSRVQTCSLFLPASLGTLQMITFKLPRCCVPKSVSAPDERQTMNVAFCRATSALASCTWLTPLTTKRLSLMVGWGSRFGNQGRWRNGTPFTLNHPVSPTHRLSPGLYQSSLVLVKGTKRPHNPLTLQVRNAVQCVQIPGQVTRVSRSNLILALAELVACCCILQSFPLLPGLLRPLSPFPSRTCQRAHRHDAASSSINLAGQSRTYFSRGGS